MGTVAVLLVAAAAVSAALLLERGEDAPSATDPDESPTAGVIQSFEVEIEDPSTATAVYKLSRPARLSVEVRGTGAAPNATALVGVGRTPDSSSSGTRRRPAEAGRGSGPFPLRYGEINFAGESRLRFRLVAEAPDGPTERSEWVTEAVAPRAR